MLNIINLEKRWLRYKIKSYIPHATIIVTLIIIGIFVSIILNSQTVANKKVIVDLKPVLDNKKTEPNNALSASTFWGGIMLSCSEVSLFILQEQLRP